MFLLFNWLQIPIVFTAITEINWIKDNKQYFIIRIVNYNLKYSEPKGNKLFII